MATKVTVPPLGESVVEATVGKWLVSEGARVEKDQPLVEILTDKADSEVPSPAAGVLRRIVRKEDDLVAPGDELGEIEEGAEASVEAKPAAPSPAVEASSALAGPSSPAVRKLALEKGVALAAVEGSGKGGRITRDDVLRAAGDGRGEEAVVEAREPAPAPSEARSALRPPPAPMPTPSSEGRAGPKGYFKLPPYQPREGDEIIPFSRRRRIIADHMVYSKQTAPDVVTLAECDLHKTSKLRDAHKNQAKKEGINLTFLAFIAAATCRALRQHPDMNARVLDDAYVRLRDINLGVAVDTEEGLVVPVIPNADELTVRGLARAIDDLAARARDGKLTPDDLANKTFTISNPGRQGNFVGGAIISQPNVGILRIGTIKKRVVVVEKDGEDLMAIHPVMMMALTYDHRIVDGVAANGFLYRITEILENGDFEV